MADPLIKVVSEEFDVVYRRSPVDSALIIDMPEKFVMPPGTLISGIVQHEGRMSIVVIRFIKQDDPALPAPQT